MAMGTCGATGSGELATITDRAEGTEPFRPESRCPFLRFSRHGPVSVELVGENCRASVGHLNPSASVVMKASALALMVACSAVAVWLFTAAVLDWSRSRTPQATVAMS